MKYLRLDGDGEEENKYSYFRIAVVILVLCIGLAGMVMLFYSFSDQDRSYEGLSDNGAAITFIVSAMALVPLLNVASFFSRQFSLVVISAGLTAYLAPSFITQLGYFACCQKGIALQGNVCTQVDIPVALGGYCLLMCSVFFSFLVCPGSLHSFPTPVNRMMLFLSFLVGGISLTASILFSVAAADQVTKDDNWTSDSDDLVNTAVLNFQASLFFFAAIFIRSPALEHASLFYLGSYYGLPLLPSLTGSYDLGETKAGSALGFVGIITMILFLLHRNLWPRHHHGEASESQGHFYTNL